MSNIVAGNKATLNFYLNNFTNEGSLINAVRNITYLSGYTNTTGGLRLMRTEIFNSYNGDRNWVPDVAVLITDGNPTREVYLLADEVRRIKNRGIDIIGVGVTKAVLLLLLLLSPSNKRTVLTRFLFYVNSL